MLGKSPVNDPQDPKKPQEDWAPVLVIAAAVVAFLLLRLIA